MLRERKLYTCRYRSRRLFLSSSHHEEVLAFLTLLSGDECFESHPIQRIQAGGIQPRYFSSMLRHTGAFVSLFIFLARLTIVPIGSLFGSSKTPIE